MVNALKFQSIVACQNGINITDPGSGCTLSDQSLPFLPLEQAMVNSSNDNKHFREQRKKVLILANSADSY